MRPTFRIRGALGRDESGGAGPAPRAPLNPRVDAFVWAAVFLATLLAAANVGRGIARAREPGALGDLVTRSREYASFRQGVYPNRRLATPPVPPATPYSVYPPYAFPMFVPLFEPGGLWQGAFVINVVSLASLVALAVFGARTLRFAGRGLAALGAVSAAAIPGVVGCFWVGQFSLGCVAFLVAQLALLQRDRAAAAGLCWAIAMIKPQIALPFAVLFLPQGRWRGLVAGGLLLVAASLAACWWTRVPPARVLHFWAFGESLTWAANAGAGGAPRLGAVVGVDPRLAQGGAALACGLAACWWARLQSSRQIDLLPLAGACGLLGAAFFYHRNYDDVMLAPAIIAVFARAAAHPGRLPVALAFLTPLVAWLPSRCWAAIPHATVWQAAAYVAAGGVLTGWALRPVPGAAAAVSRPVA